LRNVAHEVSERVVPFLKKDEKPVFYCSHFALLPPLPLNIPHGPKIRLNGVPSKVVRKQSEVPPYPPVKPKTELAYTGIETTTKIGGKMDHLLIHKYNNLLRIIIAGFLSLLDYKSLAHYNWGCNLIAS